jgi:endonuclease/exonuclease/phosphatase family metal-dependent hydrolase
MPVPSSMPLRLKDALPIPIQAGVPKEAVERIRAFKRRRAFAASDVYRELKDAIEAHTFAMEYRRPTAPAPRLDRRFLRAVTWNVERGNRLDGLKAFIASRPELTSADVVLLNEVDIGMARSGNRNVAAEIAELLGFEHVFGNSYLCLSHGDVRDGVFEIENEAGMHGNAILSRYPLIRAENFSIAVTKDKFESSERRLGHKKALWAEIETPLGVLPVVTVHLDPIASPEQRREQMRDALAVIERRELGPRVLLGGDFNTTTYDVRSVPAIAMNIGRKFLRGGFAHAIHHYMRPQDLYERGIFDELSAHGFTWDPFNAMDRGTCRYEVGTFDSESKIRDHLPEIIVKVLRYKLKPWNGVAPMKIDWFVARGLTAVREGEMEDPDGRRSLSPTVIEKPRWDGVQLSDHDPMVVDIRF